MICRVDWRTDNFPVALRYGSDVVHFFHLRIVLAGTGSGIAGCYLFAILLQFAGFLRISPCACI